MNDATLLIVDDNRDNLFIMTQLIQNFLPECGVLTATSAEEGLEIAARRCPDGALVDVQMPGMDGLEMCRRLKERAATAHLPVILITAHRADPDLKARGLDSGADDFITRPIDNQELVARVRVMLRIRRAESRLRDMNSRLSEMVAQKTLELRQALVESQQAREKVDTILRCVSDGLLVTDAQDRVVLMNHAAEELLGVRLLEVATLPVAEALGPLPHGSELMAALAGRKGGVRFDFARIEDGAARDIEGKTSVIEGPAGELHGMILSFSDVTLDRELSRMKSEFISTAAHELRTPLTSIQGFSEVLLTREDIPASDRRRYLRYIHQNTATLVNLVRDLLDLSRIEAGQALCLEKKPCTLDVLVKQYYDSYRARYPRHRFELSLPEPVPCLQVDPGKIGQVLENLLSNAVKYSPEGGEVKIQAELDQGRCRISVSDQGIGMTPEQAGKACEKFYRVDNSTTAVEGTGLGLSIVKHVVEAHGGEMRIESEPARGTRFSFTVPLHPQSP